MKKITIEDIKHRDFSSSPRWTFVDGFNEAVDIANKEIEQLKDYSNRLRTTNDHLWAELPTGQEKADYIKILQKKWQELELECARLKISSESWKKRYMDLVAPEELPSKDSESCHDGEDVVNESHFAEINKTCKVNVSSKPPMSFDGKGAYVEVNKKVMSTSDLINQLTKRIDKLETMHGELSDNSCHDHWHIAHEKAMKGITNRLSKLEEGAIMDDDMIRLEARTTEMSRITKLK